MSGRDPGALRPGLPRPVEVFLAVLGVVLLSPVLGAAALAVLLASGRPVLFRQERVGRGGRLFTLLKLRTMSGPAGRGFEPGETARVTTVGRFLRRWKLDELPQLWNVVRGDMSFVGPRPEVPGHVDLANPLWRLVLECRPGITDPVSLRFRDEESLLARWSGDRESFYRDMIQPAKLKGYVAYLQRRTAGTDLRTLVETVVVAAGLLDWPRVSLQDLEGLTPRDDGGHRN